MSPQYLQQKSQELNFYEVQSAFYKYWGDRPYEKGRGFKQFKRWEYIMEPKSYPDGKLPEPDKYWKDYTAFQLSGDGTLKGNWSPLGFTDWINGNSGYNPGNGRLNAVTVHPTNRNIIYVAAPSGGIWKSTDGGFSWNTTWDQMPVLGTSAIALHPSNPDVVYAGTGDRDAWDTKGIGIYVSYDAGASWSTTTLSFNPTYRNINKIIFNPLNPATMLAASSDGIYRSLNGGTNWQLVYSSSEVKDVKFMPGDTSVIYGSGSYFVRSADGGASFTQITATLPHDTVRTEFDVTPANPDYVYVVASKPDNTFEGLYRSTDAGLSFTAMSNSPNILGYADDGSDNAGQAWYDLAIAVAPSDANEVWVGGINVWKSSDGGANWTVNTMWYTGSPYLYIHCDIHSMNFYGDSLYVGSDGGIFMTPDHGNSWFDLSAGLGITQFYKMGSCESQPYRIAAGAQDVGSNIYKYGNWYHAFGADGMEAIVTNDDPDQIYVSYQMGGILKSTDAGENFYDARPVDTLDGGWVTPYAQHPLDNNLMFAAYQEIFRSDDGGESWYQLSSGLSGGENLDVLALAPSNTDVLYCSNKSTLYYSYDGGYTWNSSVPNSSVYIVGIDVDPVNPMRLWVAASSYYYDRIYRSDDGGQTWISMTSNLNNPGVNCIAYHAGSGLYIGTETGVLFRDTVSTNWIAFNNGLPNAPVRELEINHSLGKIRAATYGRGMWESPLSSTSGQPEADNSPEIVCYPNPVTSSLSISADKSLQKITADIFTVTGKQTGRYDLKGSRGKFELNMSGMAPGTYFIRFTHAKGSEMVKVSKL
jgi:photosystem II stability/assembly factor-like uncharacterized protein